LPRAELAEGGLLAAEVHHALTRVLRLHVVLAGWLVIEANKHGKFGGQCRRQ
jgi:hypothetical protein